MPEICSYEHLTICSCLCSTAVLNEQLYEHLYQSVGMQAQALSYPRNVPFIAVALCYFQCYSIVTQ